MHKSDPSWLLMCLPWLLPYKVPVVSWFYIKELLFSGSFRHTVSLLPGCFWPGRRMSLSIGWTWETWISSSRDLLREHLRADLTPPRTSVYLPSVGAAWGKPHRHFPRNPQPPGYSSGCGFLPFLHWDLLHWTSNLIGINLRKTRNSLVIRVLPWATGGTGTAPFPWEMYLPVIFRKVDITGSRPPSATLPGQLPTQPEKHKPD